MCYAKSFIEPYSCELRKSMTFGCFAPRSSRDELPRSNLRRLAGERARRSLGLYSVEALLRFAPLVLRTLLVTDEPPRSSLRRLAGEQALRLGFAWLSAPPTLRFKSRFSSRKKIKTECQKTFRSWRRRKDLNLRAGYPTYTLSRGASSPLEYFSMVTI